MTYEVAQRMRAVLSLYDAACETWGAISTAAAEAGEPEPVRDAERYAEQLEVVAHGLARLARAALEGMPEGAAGVPERPWDYLPGGGMVTYPQSGAPDAQ